jgi:tellurite resistance protein
MDDATTPIERVFPREGQLSPPEAQAILQLAFLATEADDDVFDEEHAWFASVVTSLRRLAGTGASMSDEALNAAIDRCADLLDEKGRQDALKPVAAALTRTEAKELGYKVAFAMSLADLETSDEESEFDADVLAALGLSEARADELSEEVYAALEVAG